MVVFFLFKISSILRSGCEKVYICPVIQYFAPNKMVLNGLLSHELFYVFYVRGCRIENTVAEKRVAVKNALKMEGEVASTTRSDPVFN